MAMAVCNPWGYWLDNKYLLHIYPHFTFVVHVSQCHVYYITVTVVTMACCSLLLVDAL